MVRSHTSLIFKYNLFNNYYHNYFFRFNYFFFKQSIKSKLKLRVFSKIKRKKNFFIKKRFFWINFFLIKFNFIYLIFLTKKLSNFFLFNQISNFKFIFIHIKQTDKLLLNSYSFKNLIKLVKWNLFFHNIFFFHHLKINLFKLEEDVDQILQYERWLFNNNLNIKLNFILQIDYFIEIYKILLLLFLMLSFNVFS